MLVVRGTSTEGPTCRSGFFWSSWVLYLECSTMLILLECRDGVRYLKVETWVIYISMLSASANKLEIGQGL